MRKAAFVASIAGFVLVAFSGATGVAAAAPPLAWKVDSKPFRLGVYRGADLLLGEHAGGIGPGSRLGYRVDPTGAMQALTDLVGSSVTASGATYTVATTEPDRTATVTVVRIPQGLRVSLDLGTAATTVRTIYESFDSTPAEHFLGTGERRDFVDLRGQIVPLKVWAGCGNGKPAPFYLSSRGYGVRFATTAIGRMAFGPVQGNGSCAAGACEIATGVPVVQACFKAASLSYEVYAGTPEQVVQSYAARSGRPPLPDPSQFAVTKWRDEVAGPADLLEDADRFQAAGIPLGWVIIDNPWEAATCVGSMQFDRRRFPDPAAMIAGLHAREIRVMMWISPMVQSICGRDIYPVGRIGPGYLQALDLTDPAVTATFEQRIEGLLGTGIDGFKVDRGDEVDLDGLSLAGGSGADVHDAYPALVAKAIDDASVAARGKLLPTLFRAGFMGSQSLVTGAWSGDLPGTWDGLAAAVRSAQTAGLVGFSTWGSDIGGYESPDLASDVFVRWAQLGAISPVFEVGGTGANARPWELGQAAMDGLRTAAVLHQELFPDLYQLARGASRTGLPVLRPLGLRYPGDARAWSASEELLVGPDLLAAPVAGQGTTPSVYLPAGVWNDLATGARVAGPAAFTRQTPLDELPLYLRSGAAIPYNLRSPDIWSSPWGSADLFRDGRGGWLLAPGPGTAAADSAEYGSLRSTVTGRRLGLLLTRARRETEVLVLDHRVPVRVLVDGKRVARSSSLAALRSARQGWLPKVGATRGLIVKLAPRSGRSAVELRF